jgi:hypothetical protein
MPTTHDADKATEVVRAFGLMTIASLDYLDRAELYKLIRRWVARISPDANEALAGLFHEIEILFELKWQNAVARARNSKFKDRWPRRRR